MAYARRHMLAVPRRHSDEAKSLGARWDGSSNLWWCLPRDLPGPLMRWDPSATPEESHSFDIGGVGRWLSLATRTFDEEGMGRVAVLAHAIPALPRTEEVLDARLSNSTVAIAALWHGSGWRRDFLDADDLPPCVRAWSMNARCDGRVFDREVFDALLVSQEGRAYVCELVKLESERGRFAVALTNTSIRSLPSLEEIETQVLSCIEVPSLKPEGMRMRHG